MRRLLAAASLALPLVLACSSATPPGGSGGSGGAGPSDAGPGDAARPDAPADAPTDAAACVLVSAYSSQNAGCNACAEAKCCAEINGCLGEPGCNDDYVNCILACAFVEDAGDAGVATCLDACAAQYPQGKAEYDVAIGCAEQACAAECQ
jgi:hypothetical protein